MARKKPPRTDAGGLWGTVGRVLTGLGATPYRQGIYHGQSGYHNKKAEPKLRLVVGKMKTIFD